MRITAAAITTTQSKHKDPHIVFFLTLSYPDRSIEAKSLFMVDWLIA